MAIKIKYSKKYNAVMQRVKRLPKIYVDQLKTIRKKDAFETARIFQEGIAQNKLGLESLKAITIRSKRSKGMTKPATPLYGEGLQSLRSYLNSLRIKRIKNGWKVEPRTARHHSGGVSLKTLFFIHEFGATFTNGVRIPPRPAFFRSFRRMIKRRKKSDDAKLVREAVVRILKEGETKWLEKQLRQQGIDNRFERD